MPTVLHKLAEDGSVTHEDLTRTSWESAMADKGVSRFWGHPDGECHDVVAKHFAIIRADGHECSAYQHEWADKHDPTWEGSREIVASVELSWSAGSITLEQKSNEWPPTEELSVWMLCQMTTLCMSDAKLVLSAPRKEPSPVEVKPRADKRGQFSLF